MKMICLDVEGVLFPEIWQIIASDTGIEALARTTRDEPNYEQLMSDRLAALNSVGASFDDLVKYACRVEPLPGASEFLSRLKARYQVALVSDSYYEFLLPLGVKLGAPAIYCHHLLRASDGTVKGWQPRLVDQKPKCVRAFQNLGFEVFAAGDSFNDLGMLDAADGAAFMNAPDRISALRPNLQSCHDYLELEDLIHTDAFHSKHD